MPSAEQAQNFGEAVALELMRRRRAGRKPGNVTELAKAIDYARGTVSRALNQEEFPEVRAAIARRLGLATPATAASPNG